MIRNYIKTAWRTITKNKTYATINILGLTIGLSACMLVATVVLDDLSYDQQWGRKDDLYRIITADTTAGMEGRTSTALANLGKGFKDNFPEVEEVTSITSRKYQLRIEELDNLTMEVPVIRADTNVWRLLDFKITNGNPQQYVAGQANLIISESFRKQHFPNEDPVGKTIYQVSATQEKATKVLITGIMEDLPQNSYLRADAIHITLPISVELNRQGWGFYDEQLILMKPGTDMVVFAEKANRWYRDFLTEATDNLRGRIPIYEFQPVPDIYLHSDFAYQEVKGSLANIYIFSGIAVLLLLIACINFINLNTAAAIQRLRETGIRKVMGALRRQLIGQFLTESLMVFSISAILAVSLYMLAIGPLETFLGHQLVFSMLDNGTVTFLFLLIIIVLSLFTGIYPAWVLSGSKTAFALKNQFNSQVFKGSWVRRMLVISQFSMALIVLIGLFTVWSQVQFMENKDPGYEPETVLSIPSFLTGNNAQALKQEISKITGVQQVSLSGWTPTSGIGNMSSRIKNPDNPDEWIEVAFISADADMPAVLGMKVIQGRLFDEREAATTFSLNKLIMGDEVERLENRPLAKALITASTARLVGITELGQFNNALSAIPIGIIEDIHSKSLHEQTIPTVIFAEETRTYSGMLIKVQAGQESRVSGAIHKLWKEFHPDKPLEIKYLNDMVLAQYEKEAKQQQLFFLFSSLMLFLAALGVFGMIVQATGQRIKEIGVRKVLGASVTSIVGLFSRDYVRLVLVAALIASPIAWWLMNKWLEDFAYRTEIQWWMFALAVLVALAVALLTVSGQAIRAAVANPVDSLRDE